MSGTSRYTKCPESIDIVSTAFLALMERLNGIEEKLDKRVAHWLAEDAVQAYREYIQVHHRCPVNFGPLLLQFQSVFQGRNVAQIVPNEVEGFLFSRWGHLQKSTIKKRQEQLMQFFNFCINELRRKGSPDFNNPVKLVQRIKAPPKIREGFLPVEKIQELLATCKDIKHWLIFAIMATGGLRVGEVLKLTPADINGRILTLRQPKSGKDKEYAVIPQVVTDKLKEYSKFLHPDKPIFPGKTSWINNLLRDRLVRLRLERLSSHDLRRWCATYYDRKGEYSMRRFVLRHSNIQNYLTSLEARYVAQLSIQEATTIQDSTLVEEMKI